MTGHVGFRLQIVNFFTTSILERNTHRRTHFSVHTVPTRMTSTVTPTSPIKAYGEKVEEIGNTDVPPGKCLVVLLSTISGQDFL